ncbi:hypothetical protein NMG60_11005238 [Bertholletia excelsa]
MTGKASSTHSTLSSTSSFCDTVTSARRPMMPSTMIRIPPFLGPPAAARTPSSTKSCSLKPPTTNSSPSSMQSPVSVSTSLSSSIPYPISLGSTSPTRSATSPSPLTRLAEKWVTGKSTWRGTEPPGATNG